MSASDIYLLSDMNMHLAIVILYEINQYKQIFEQFKRNQFVMSLSDSLDDSLQNMHKKSYLKTLEQEFDSRNPWNKSPSSKKGYSSPDSNHPKVSGHKRFLTQTEEDNQQNAEILSDNDELLSENDNILIDDEEEYSVRYLDQQTAQIKSKQSFDPQIQPSQNPTGQIDVNANSQYFGLCDQKLQYYKNSALSSFANSPQDQPKLSQWSQSSNKLTYSSDKKIQDAISVKQNRYITFGQMSNPMMNNPSSHNKRISYDTLKLPETIDQQLKQAEYYLQKKDLNEALKILEHIENQNTNDMNCDQKIYHNYLYAMTFYSIEQWVEFEYSANLVVEQVFSKNRDNKNIQMDKQIDMLLHCLQMLVTSYLKQNLFEKALKNQAMLVELANGRGKGNVEQHIILGEIHKKLSRYRESFVTFCKAQSLLCTQEQLKLIYQNLYYLSQQLENDDDCVKYGSQLVELVDHQTAINIYTTMAKIYHQQKNILQTISCLSSLLKHQIEQYGYNNQQTCGVMMNVAKLELDQGLYAQSYERFKTATAIISQLQGTRNLQFASCQINMGIACFYLQDYQKSFDHYTQVYSLYEKHYGSTHDHTIRIQLNLLQILAKQKLTEKANSLYNQIVIVLKSLKDKQKSVQFCSELAEILIKQKIYPLTLNAYNLTLQFMEENEQSDDIQLQKCMLLQTMGSTYVLNGQMQQGLDCYQDSQILASQLHDKQMVTQLEQQIVKCFTAIGLGLHKNTKSHKLVGVGQKKVSTSIDKTRKKLR